MNASIYCIKKRVCALLSKSSSQFYLTDCVSVGYMKHQSGDVCVLYNYLCYIVGCETV